MKKLMLSLLILLISIGLYLASFVEIPFVDKESNAYFTGTLKSATLAYATTRGVNAVVSVLKESEVNVSPAGVGLTIAAGQILDPIDDMTERLSSVIVMAIVSLGIQKIGFELGAAFSFKLVAALILLFIPALWLNLRAPNPLLRLAVRFCYFLIVLRFLLPISSLVNDYLYDNLFKARIEESVRSLSVISSDYNEMSRMEPGGERGFFSSLTGAVGTGIEKTKQAFSRVLENAESIISSLLNLTTLYVALFIIQVLFIPLGMLWLLMALARSPATNLLTDRVLALFGRPDVSET
ncbi:MAG: hypothetical protein KJ558_13865 [Gammaproteobacteria bacterium]|nr:hypothetical protein [Gammaproteobacteria bacterium]MBU1655879.1 hypothetical protein [Gammaproteobacteria bacterium]MBU1960622.1 hypothetical protein [Gammaproteobacteria bacterium]